MGDGCGVLDEAIRNGGRGIVAQVGGEATGKLRAGRDRVAFDGTQETVGTVRGRITREIEKKARCMMRRSDRCVRPSGEAEEKP